MEAQSWKSPLARSVIGFSERFRLATFPFHANEVVTSFIAYNGILHVIAPALSKAVVPKQYARLSDRSKISWNFRAVSFVQSALVCGMALRIIMSDSNRHSATRDERLWGYSPSVGRIQAYATGYFMFDLLATLQYYDVFGWTSLTHGASALAITLLGFVSAMMPQGVSMLTRKQRPFGNYYGVNFILYEISTPFLNVHWVLDKLELTGTKIQFYNGICLMGSFFGSRLVWGSYQTWLLSKDIISAWGDYLSGQPYAPQMVLENGTWHNPSIAEATSSYNFPKYLLGTYLVANTVLTGLNFYWFGLMVKAMRKRFTQKKKKDD